MTIIANSSALDALSSALAAAKLHAVAWPTAINPLLRRVQTQLAAQDLTLLQATARVDGERQVTTRILHASGQWIDLTVIAESSDDLDAVRARAIAIACGLSLGAQADNAGESAPAPAAPTQEPAASATVDPEPLPAPATPPVAEPVSHVDDGQEANSDQTRPTEQPAESPAETRDEANDRHRREFGSRPTTIIDTPVGEAPIPSSPTDPDPVAEQGQVEATATPPSEPAPLQPAATETDTPPQDGDTAASDVQTLALIEQVRAQANALKTTHSFAAIATEINTCLGRSPNGRPDIDRLTMDEARKALKHLQSLPTKR